ncbi:ComEC/Rec2 family competence protein [Hyalangium rubrum]|uniref:MBL fold metallo-hydrolase n=1 Tax=Hyalangium rubrum TaxID=3103134 RepID=A0ABU5H4Y7_9BACT|nr:MBL fold metallo-hydrolase [Hyalangium sp. s54d21]MDY7228528.1 MBL fold metallo-hydrolase [Hyalangium sp. s54d21]
MNARLLPLLGLLLLATACKEPPPKSPSAPPRPSPAAATRFLAGPPDGKLHVYFFDVGQGDSALIVSPEGRTVLIDTGPASAASHLTNRLPELLASRLDLVVLTHPAADHYGALEAIQKVTDPKRLLEPQLPGTSSDYDALLTSLGSGGVEIFSPALNPSQPEESLRLPLGGGAELTVLWPRVPTTPLLTVQGAADTKSAEHQANSIVLRLTHGETSVLFAGDARAETEAALLARGGKLSATLLKVSAHGADTGTSPEFLQWMRPRAAILSVGAGSPPAKPALDRLAAANARIFRTDQNGEMHAVSDGKRFVLTTQRAAPGEPANAQHAFEPVAEEPPAPPPVVPPVAAKPEPVKAVPVKATSAKAKADVDLSGYKVVDIDEMGTATEKPAKGVRTTKTPSKATPGRYVASRRSDVFHIPECRNARKISPENLLTFSTRESAEKDRRPAKDCNP